MREPGCSFCSIVAGDLPALVTHCDEEAMAFRDISPVAPFHELVIPRRHLANLSAASVADGPLLGHLMLVALGRAEAAGHANDGFRVVVNVGRDGHQTVGHLHLHVLAGRPLGWPPG